MCVSSRRSNVNVCETVEHHRQYTVCGAHTAPHGGDGEEPVEHRGAAGRGVAQRHCEAMGRTDAFQSLSLGLLLRTRLSQISQQPYHTQGYGEAAGAHNSES